MMLSNVQNILQTPTVSFRVGERVCVFVRFSICEYECVSDSVCVCVCVSEFV